MLQECFSDLDQKTSSVLVLGLLFTSSSTSESRVEMVLHTHRFARTPWAVLQASLHRPQGFPSKEPRFMLLQIAEV